MWAVAVEIPVEECRCEQRHDGFRLAKARKLLQKPHVGLVRREATDCQICTLRAHEGFDLPRHAFLPGESLSDHDRFTGKYDRRLLRIHRLIGAAYAISRRIESILDHTAGDSTMPAARRHENPAEPTVGMMQRFLPGRHLLRGAMVCPPENRLTCSECQYNSERHPSPGRKEPAPLSAHDEVPNSPA